MSTTRTSVDITLSVWKALFLREALTRLSAGRSAWLWLLLEPVAHVAFLLIIFSAIRQRVIPGVEFALFLAIGVIGYHLFKNSAQRSIGAISANAALFSYRQGKPVDAVLVRIFLEGVIQLFVGVVLLAAMSLIGYDVLPHNPLGVIAAWMLLWLFGAGLGLILSVGSKLIPEIGKIANLMFIPLYFISGVLFAPFMLPPTFQEWFLLNPIPHGLEALREGFFPGYQLVPGVSLYYLGVFAFLSLFFGLVLHVRFSTKLVAH